MTNPFEDENSTREGALVLSFAHQHQWLRGERLKTQADYWRQTLVDAPVLLTLPTDRPRPPQQSFAGASIPIHLDAELTQGLKSLSQEHGATLFMTLLTAWVAVLARLSGQQDVVIGTPSASRGRPEIEDLIGFFVNTLALRIDLSGQPSVAELLARVRAATLAAQDHQDLPFEQVLEIVQPPRRLEHTPLFQVMFAWWQSDDEQEHRLAGLSVEPFHLTYDVARFDLGLSLREADGTIVGVLVYATALFDAATIEHQRGYLLKVLRAMVTQPLQPIMRIDLLDSQERELLLNTWNQTETPYPEDRCIHQLFEEQVRRDPEATAVVFQDQSLTYGELNTQANRLAYRLIDLGVKPDQRVAICVERSLAMVVGLFAILKAGGSYVPLDPRYPFQRLAYMLEDAQPAVLLVDRAGHQSLSEVFFKQPVIALDTDQADWAELPAANPQPWNLRSSNLACVFYTSGSTGTPKGVMVEHRNIVNIVSHVIRVWDLSCHDVVLQFAAPAFDASVEEIFGALLSGGTLVLRNDNWIGNPLEFWRLCDDARLTIVDLPTRFFDVAVKNTPGSIPSSIRLLAIGGDAVEKQTLEHWFEIPNNHAQLWNTYGPTECTVESIIGLIGAEDLVPHIGRPTANTRIYLLDEYGDAVPLGVIGEIFIGGAGVARGYLNLPGPTSERFLRDPFCSTPGARVYRTGDLARYLPDGNIQFIGRNDSQLKIRGFRIEPGEVESRLTQHPAISKAVVIAREDTLGDKRLVAYLVTDSSDPKELLATALRNYLSASLPNCMLPSAFVCLEAIPLNSNGKLNVNALPVPDEQSYAHQAYEPPQGELEATLAEVWGEILGLKQISRHDNFFQLGGHSLLAVELLERLRQLGLEIEIRSLFSNPVLSELARNLVGQNRCGIDNIEHEEFFRRMLGDIDEATLPFGISDVRCDAGRLILSDAVALDSELSCLLRAQARRLGVSVASLCHIAWARVVGAISGRKRVVFGTVLFGRMDAGAGSDRAMGLFMNTLPIRLDIDDTSVEESAWQTHGRLAGLLRHEHASLAMAQRCSAVKPPCPLFSAVFNYRRVIYPQRDVSTAISGAEFLGEQYYTNYPITMSVNDAGEGLALVGQALEPHAPEILCHYMLQALTSLAAALDKAPYTSVGELEVVPPSERCRQGR